MIKGKLESIIYILRYEQTPKLGTYWMEVNDGSLIALLEYESRKHHMITLFVVDLTQRIPARYS
jgi:hypothetical protein